MTPTMIRLERVSKSFGAVRAVSSASIEVGKGEFVALLGPSGCGKTTLLRLIAGFEAPDEGTVRIGEQMVAGGAWIPPERRHAGMVFQDYDGERTTHGTIVRDRVQGCGDRVRPGLPAVVRCA